jgi:hypothetical protein
MINHSVMISVARPSRAQRLNRPGGGAAQACFFFWPRRDSVPASRRWMFSRWR